MSLAYSQSRSITGADRHAAYRGLWIPLVTPFRHEAIDHKALQRLVQHLGACGVRGFVACGSTGEAALMEPHEQDALLATV